jgi:hypothetical protein
MALAHHQLALLELVAQADHAAGVEAQAIRELSPRAIFRLNVKVSAHAPTTSRPVRRVSLEDPVKYLLVPAPYPTAAHT